MPDEETTQVIELLRTQITKLDGFYDQIKRDGNLNTALDRLKTWTDKTWRIVEENIGKETAGELAPRHGWAINNMNPVGSFTPQYSHYRSKVEVLIERLEEDGLEEIRELDTPPVIRAAPTVAKKPNLIFIGHGGSLLWMVLKEHLEKDLKLPCQEFNSISTAGMDNIERLNQLLESATFAFLILTAEDEQPDGTRRARENVVHEAGLFQGKLGFRNAIILLEDGCNEPSNIVGHGQIRFPEGKIDAAFHKIRKHLVEVGLVQS